MTLTTEQLRARAKFWREKAVEAKWESVGIAQDMLQNADAFDELAANREAQPVIVVAMMAATHWHIADSFNLLRLARSSTPPRQRQRQQW
ncbi:hypothetical protein AB4J75_09570 [Serratia marcescens]|uniref:hypothetical protein n=1 Tax=Serratia marcescens TaxID=615 RepID=UPI003D0027C3